MIFDILPENFKLDKSYLVNGEVEKVSKLGKYKAGDILDVKGIQYEIKGAFQHDPSDVYWLVVKNPLNGRMYEVFLSLEALSDD